MNDVLFPVTVNIHKEICTKVDYPLDDYESGIEESVNFNFICFCSDDIFIQNWDSCLIKDFEGKSLWVAGIGSL